MPGIEVPITFGCENQQGLWLSEAKAFWRPRQLSERACTYLLELTPSELQYWGGSSEGAKNIQAETELCGYWPRAGGAALSQTEVLAEAIVLYAKGTGHMRPEPLRVCFWKVCSINQDNTFVWKSHRKRLGWACELGWGSVSGISRAGGTVFPG